MARSEDSGTVLQDDLRPIMYDVRAYKGAAERVLAPEDRLRLLERGHVAHGEGRALGDEAAEERLARHAGDDPATPERRRQRAEPDPADLDVLGVDPVSPGPLGEAHAGRPARPRYAPG